MAAGGRRVWEDFSVDDDPTFFPDPLESRLGPGADKPTPLSGRKSREVSFRIPDRGITPQHDDKVDSTSFSSAGDPRTNAGVATSPVIADPAQLPVTTATATKRRFSDSTSVAPMSRLNAAPRRGSLPARWMVPDEGRFSGYLFRQKGKWKRQWARELFAVQHNVLLICPKEQPLLIKHCIPLINLQNIETEAKDTRKFIITYLAPLRKGRSKPDKIICRANDETERDLWVTKLSDFMRKAWAKGKPISDFVEKEAAERSLHTAYRNLKHSACTSLVNIASAAHHRQLCLAFSLWRSIISHEVLTQSKALVADADIRVATRTTQLETEVKTATRRAKGERALLMAADRLQNYRRHMTHYALLKWKRVVDQQATEQLAAGAASLITYNWRAQAETQAQSAVSWRRKRVYGTLVLMYQRRLWEAFETLRLNASFAVARRKQRQELLRTIMRRREDMILSDKRLILQRWRERIALTVKQHGALRACLINEENVQRRALLRRWYMNVSKKSVLDVAAVTKLVAALKIVSNLDKSWAFRRLFQHMDEQSNLECLQVAANFNVVNSKLVKSFNQIPMHRGALLYVTVIHRVQFANLQHAFVALRGNTVRQRHLERSCRAFSAIWNNLSRRRRIQRAFYWLSRNAHVCAIEELDKSHKKEARDNEDRHKRRVTELGVSHFVASIQVILQLHQTNDLVSAFNKLRREALMGTLQEDKDRFVATMDKVITRGRRSAFDLFTERFVIWCDSLRRRQLALALIRFEANHARSDALRRVLRLYLLQRTVQLLDRSRVAHLAVAFEKLKNYKLNYDTLQEHTVEAQEHVQSSMRLRHSVHHNQTLAAIQEETVSREASWGSTNEDSQASSRFTFSGPESPPGYSSKLLSGAWAERRKYRMRDFKIPYATPRFKRLSKERGYLNSALRKHRRKAENLRQARAQYRRYIPHGRVGASRIQSDPIVQDENVRPFSEAVRAALDEADRYLNSASSRSGSASLAEHSIFQPAAALPPRPVIHTETCQLPSAPPPRVFVESHEGYVTTCPTPFVRLPAMLSPREDGPTSTSLDSFSGVDLGELDEILEQLSGVTLDTWTGPVIRSGAPPARPLSKGVRSEGMSDYLDMATLYNYIHEERKHSSSSDGFSTSFPSDVWSMLDRKHILRT